MVGGLIFATLLGGFQCFCERAWNNFLASTNGDYETECSVVDGSGAIPANKELYLFAVSDVEPKRYGLYRWPRWTALITGRQSTQFL